MSVINKPDLKIFAQDAKTGEVETFPDILRGWGITLDRTAGKPPLEWFNAVGKRVDEWLMYLTQRGVAEWDTTLSYPKTAIVQFNSVVYVSIKENKGEQPDKSQAAWSTLGVYLGLG
ncbi:histidine kinase, partial [Providencia rettgeri]